MFNVGDILSIKDHMVLVTGGGSIFNRSYTYKVLHRGCVPGWITPADEDWFGIGSVFSREAKVMSTAEQCPLVGILYL